MSSIEQIDLGVNEAATIKLKGTPRLKINKNSNKFDIFLTPDTQKVKLFSKLCRTSFIES